MPNKCLEPLSNPFFGNNIKNLLEENLINQLINESSDMQSTRANDTLILSQMKRNVQKLIKYTRKKLQLIDRLELRVN